MNCFRHNSNTTQGKAYCVVCRGIFDLPSWDIGRTPTCDHCKGDSKDLKDRDDRETPPRPEIDESKLTHRLAFCVLCRKPFSIHYYYIGRTPTCDYCKDDCYGHGHPLYPRGFLSPTSSMSIL